jgi:hypothetical protein
MAKKLKKVPTLCNHSIYLLEGWKDERSADRKKHGNNRGIRGFLRWG